jgi:hypothetical protein
MKSKEEIDAYLARIRRTIAESNDLVGKVELRIAETDRMLAKQGLTREQVLAFDFTDAQREAVNRELARRGLDPIGETGPAGDGGAPRPVDAFAPPPPPPAAEDGGELALRRAKFSMMMKPFRL